MRRLVPFGEEIALDNCAVLWRPSSAKGLKQGQELRGWTPPTARPLLEMCPFPERLQSDTLHAQIHLRVPVCCGDARVTKQISNDGHINAGLEHRDGRAVPK